MEQLEPLPTVIWFPSLASTSDHVEKPDAAYRNRAPARMARATSAAEDRARLLRLIG